MKLSKFPEGWDEERIHRVLAHYEKQTEEAAYENTTQTTIDVPVELVPAIRELIAKHKTLQHQKTTADNSG